MKNKIVVITGGATGIGLGMAKEFVKNNTVVSIDRTPAKIEALKQTLPEVYSIKADVTFSQDLDKAIEEIKNKYGKIDVLINNAGAGKAFDFVNMSEEELMSSVDIPIAVNYRAPILLTKKALPLLRKSEAPMVIVISSGLAYMPMATLGSYCATKTAVHFITMCIRHQLKPLNIKVVEVLPPTVDTELVKTMNVKKMSTEEFTSIFLKKLSKGEEVINVGQSASLNKFSRLFPGFAFKMLNRG